MIQWQVIGITMSSFVPKDMEAGDIHDTIHIILFIFKVTSREHTVQSIQQTQPAKRSVSF